MVQEEIQAQAGKFLTQMAGFVGVKTIQIGLTSGLLEAVSGHTDGITARSLASTTGPDELYVSVWVKSAYDNELPAVGADETTPPPPPLTASRSSSAVVDVRLTTPSLGQGRSPMCRLISVTRPSRFWIRRSLLIHATITSSCSFPAGMLSTFFLAARLCASLSAMSMARMA